MNTILIASIAIFLLLNVRHSDAFARSPIACGIELVGNTVGCVLDCRKEHHCVKMEMMCDKIKIKLFRSLCKAMLKCGCPNCVKCIAKCIVRRFFNNNICFIGGYLKKLLTALNIYNYFDLNIEADQEEAMELVLDRLAHPEAKLDDLTADSAGLDDIE